MRFTYISDNGITDYLQTHRSTYLLPLAACPAAFVAAELARDPGLEVLHDVADDELHDEDAHHSIARGTEYVGRISVVHGNHARHHPPVNPQIDPGLGPRADKRVKGGRGAEMGLPQQQRRLPRRLALLRLDGGNTEEGMESYYTLSDEWVSLEASSSLSSAAQSKSGDESMAQLVRVPVLVAATGAFPYNP